MHDSPEHVPLVTSNGIYLFLDKPFDNPDGVKRRWDSVKCFVGQSVASYISWLRFFGEANAWHDTWGGFGQLLILPQTAATVLENKLFCAGVKTLIFNLGCLRYNDLLQRYGRVRVDVALWSTLAGVRLQSLCNILLQVGANAKPHTPLSLLAVLPHFPLPTLTAVNSWTDRGREPQRKRVVEYHVTLASHQWAHIAGISCHLPVRLSSSR